MKLTATRAATACLLLSTTLASSLNAADQSATDGRSILESQCGRCHSIAKIGTSPLGSAPPLREIYRRYPIEQLEFELSEGVGSRHKRMPQIQFSDEQIEKILTYLQSITDTK